MDLARVVVARSVWLFDIEEFNPGGKQLIPTVTNAIRDRYRFLHFPQKIEDFDETKGIEFEAGSFLVADSEVRVGLTIYNDGLVCTTSTSTSVSDSVLEDLLTWLADQFGLGNKPDLLAMKKVYRSELVVFAPGIDLTGLTDKLTRFCRLLDDAHGGSAGSAFEPEALVFGSDPDRRQGFTFERRVKAPFSERKYYSSASLTTDKHLELLQELEMILAGK